MARRARRGIQNPLLDYRVEEDVPKKDMHRSLQPLLVSTAKDRYRLALANVPLDLEIRVCSEMTEDRFCNMSREQMRELMQRAQDTGRTVLLFTPDSAPRHLRDRPKGETLRISPFTAFTVLHRLGDVLCDQNNLGDTTYLTDAKYSLYLIFGKSTPSAGVDTEAGRRNVLHDVANARADLFAKYLLTGRIAFDPYVQGPEALKTARIEWLNALRLQFPEMVRHAIGKVFLL